MKVISGFPWFFSCQICHQRRKGRNKLRQTTPAVHVIYDANASVSNVNFVGQDLDLEEPGQCRGT